MDKLNLMASFIAVAEEGKFTAAAKRLGKTKALVSTHISQLEELLGIRLITRSTRSLVLTPAGRCYYEQAKKVLDDIAALEDQLTAEHQTLVGRLRVTTPMSFCELVMMPYVAEITERNPKLLVEIMLSDRYVDIIGEGFDLAIRIGRLDDSTLVAKTLGQIRMLLCATPEFIKRYGEPKAPDDLVNMPCVLDTNNRQSNSINLRVEGQSVEVSPKVVTQVNSAQAAVNMARTGTVMTYCPDFVIHSYLESGELQVLLNKYCQVTLPISAVYPHRKHLSAKVTSFISGLADYLAGSKNAKVT